MSSAAKHLPTDRSVGFGRIQRPIFLSSGDESSSSEDGHSLAQGRRISPRPKTQHAKAHKTVPSPRRYAAGQPKASNNKTSTRIDYTEEMPEPKGPRDYKSADFKSRHKSSCYFPPREMERDGFAEDDSDGVLTCGSYSDCEDANDHDDGDFQGRVRDKYDLDIDMSNWDAAIEADEDAVMREGEEEEQDSEQAGSQEPGGSRSTVIDLTEDKEGIFVMSGGLPAS